MNASDCDLKDMSLNAKQRQSGWTIQVALEDGLKATSRISVLGMKEL
ncbi:MULTISPECIES: hypothetical protein [unclassified Ruegeria]|nr:MULTISPECIES: hypothetical protein [unclassified Ruegeria]NOD49784.1 hypothetical protein [Ruegeria sp. HKCCD5849]NOD54114.1 hypothetical protein [Ruegeria sp. HKCCD5851]NOD70115.1 hypothetical protein [Ruegeria sp. HKCCD7303]